MSRGPWGAAWRRLRSDRLGVLSLALLALLAALALTAPLVANDAPIAASWRGRLCFPAVHDYLAVVVPWRSARWELESLEVAGTHPLSPHYPALDGATWLEVRHEPDLDWALWPPLPWDHDTSDRLGAGLLAPPSRAHPLGTDDVGRDVLARLVHGTVVAAQVGVVAMGIATSLGVVLGLLAGFLGGLVDTLLSRLTEVVMCFPTFFLIIAVMAFVEPSVVNVMAVLGLVGWTGIFRLVRGEVLAVRGLDYVASARALGLPTWRIMTAHVLPNAIAPVFVAVAFGVAGAILAETALSFLGFGDGTAPSWGELVHQGRVYMTRGHWHLVLFPGLALFLTLTAFNLLGQSLRDALDPRSSGAP